MFHGVDTAVRDFHLVLAKVVFIFIILQDMSAETVSDLFGIGFDEVMCRKVC